MYSFVSGFFHPTMFLRSIKDNVYIRSSFISTASSAPLFVYALIDLLIDIWSIFQFWAVTNKAAMNILIQVFFVDICLLLWGYIFRNRIIVSLDGSMFNIFKNFPKTSNMVVQLYTLLAIYERPS